MSSLSVRLEEFDNDQYNNYDNDHDNDQNNDYDNDHDNDYDNNYDNDNDDDHDDDHDNDNDNDNVSTISKRSNVSEVWDFFKKLEWKKERKTAKCMVSKCQHKEFSCGKGGTTKPL